MVLTVHSAAEVGYRMKADAELFRVLVDGVLDYAIVMLGIDGRVMTWNRGAKRVYGYTPEEIVGVHFSELCSEADVAAEKPHAELAASLSLGRFEDEGWRLRKGGSAFWANVVITPLSESPSDSQPFAFAMVTSDLTDRLKLDDDFAHANDRLRALASHVSAASEREKKRVAREIHDVLGQELTGLKMDAAWITRRLSRPEPADLAPLLQRLREMTKQIDDCVRTVRRIATDVRPTVLDDLGLAAAIDLQVRAFETRSGIAVDLSLPEGDASVNPDHATALFRILQEVLTNTARHANSSAVKVALVQQPGLLTLEMHDNGRGITDLELADAKSLGLLGIRERVALIGGFLDIRGKAGIGTSVTVRVPVPA